MAMGQHTSEMNETSEAWGHLGLGETYSIAGQAEKALDSLSKAREMGREMGMDYYLARTEKALEKPKAQ